MRLVVPGEARGKGRPRFARGRVYTDTPTLRAEQRIADEWRAAGGPRLPDAPLTLHVTLYLDRPANHHLTDGTLSAQGRRNGLPVRKPDVDNALKLVCDALNGRAYRDDVQIVDATARRRWAPRGENARTVIELEAADAPLESGSAAVKERAR